MQQFSRASDRSAEVEHWPNVVSADSPKSLTMRIARWRPKLAGRTHHSPRFAERSPKRFSLAWIPPVNCRWRPAIMNGTTAKKVTLAVMGGTAIGSAFLAGLTMWLLVTQPMMVPTAVTDHSVTPLLPSVIRGLHEL